jgi:hypothetical protein
MKATITVNVTIDGKPLKLDPCTIEGSRGAVFEAIDAAIGSAVSDVEFMFQDKFVYAEDTVEPAKTESSMELPAAQV